MMLRLVTMAIVMAATAAGCATSRGPELRLVGVNNRVPRHEVFYLQVTNPANRPMRLTKLEYTFAAGSMKVYEGEIAFEREVPAGQAVVVEVPLDHEVNAPEPTALRGKLTAVLDEIVRTFPVSAEIH